MAKGVAWGAKVVRGLIIYAHTNHDDVFRGNSYPLLILWKTYPFAWDEG